MRPFAVCRLHSKAAKKLDRRLQALAAEHDVVRQELLIKAAELLDMQAQLKEAEGRHQLQQDSACEQVTRCGWCVDLIKQMLAHFWVMFHTPSMGSDGVLCRPAEGWFTVFFRQGVTAAASKHHHPAQLQVERLQQQIVQLQEQLQSAALREEQVRLEAQAAAEDRCDIQLQQQQLGYERQIQVGTPSAMHLLFVMAHTTPAWECQEPCILFLCNAGA